TNQVRQRMFAENDVHGSIALLPAVNAVELLRALLLEPSAVVAGKQLPDRTAQDALVCCHPVETAVVGQGQHIVGDAAFRWPHAFGTDAKNLFVQRQTANDLLSRVFRMAETLPGKRKSGVGNSPGAGIADQRKNRMVKRRGGNL